MIRVKLLAAAVSRRRFWQATGCAVIFAALSVVTRATGGHSFTSLDSNYTQALVATTQMPNSPINATEAIVLGGIAFAPGGDLWVADCVSQHTRLHRFALAAPPLAPVHETATLHAETAVVATEGGCGLVNWANPALGRATLFSNAIDGVYELDASTGAVLRGPLGPRGNSLGIAVDPQTNHVVYPGIGCHPRLWADAGLPALPLTCTLWDLDPAAPDGHPTMWAETPHDRLPYLDGIYFSPSGSHLFVANRVENQGLNYLSILTRPATPLAGDGQIVRDIAMTSEPDGVAFHDSSDPFVLTNDEFDSVNGVGTLTRFDFPSGFDGPPSMAVANDDLWYPYETRFGNGGFRGDLAQVGADGCLYLTQGRFFADNGFGEPGNGTRYDDGTLSTEDSIVKICGLSGGFIPAAGVTDTVNGAGATLGNLGGLVFRDSNGNGLRDGAEPPLPGVSITLGGAATDTAMSQADGTYRFSALSAGAYTVTAPSSALGLARSTTSPLSWTLAAGENKGGLDFGYKPGSIGGSVFVDMNGNGTFDAGENPLGGVTVTLTGPVSATTLTDSGGNFVFTNLPGGTFGVSVPPTVNGQTTNTRSATVTVATGGSTGISFAYGAALACPAGWFNSTIVGGNLVIVYDQFPAPNDNSYGANAVGWGTKGHRFSDLVGSDHAGFQLVDPGGVVRLDFNIDYISAAAAAPSGYKSLGPFGGDGSVNIGVLTPADITYDTSFARNLNNVNVPGLFNPTTHLQVVGTSAANILVDSPPTVDKVSNYILTAAAAPFAGWDFHDTYFVTIGAAKLAALGFDAATWTVKPNLDSLHNSPAKPCPPASPVPTPTPTAPTVSVTKVVVDKTQVKITILNSGSVDTIVTGLMNVNWPALTNGKLKQVKLGGDVLYDKPDIATGPVTLTSQLVADPNKRKIKHGSSDVLTLIFEKNASTTITEYDGQLQLDGASILDLFP